MLNNASFQLNEIRQNQNLLEIIVTKSVQLPASKMIDLC